MALALLANVLPRVISILNANPGVWSSTVSGNVGSFPSDAEILAAVLESDEFVATQCYFQSANKQLSAAFDAPFGPLQNGDQLPFSHGGVSKIFVTPPGPALPYHLIKAQSLDDILQAIATSGYYDGGSPLDYLYWLEDGHLYTTATDVEGIAPIYTRTSVLQCDRNEESLIVFRAVANLAKNASPALFEYYSGKADAGQQQIIAEGQYSGEADEQN